MLSKMFDLSGKVVFLTGAGRGIGRGIAQVLAEAGADLVINALTPNYVVDTAKAIAEVTGRRVLPFLGDVTRSDEVARAVDFVAKEFGHLDILFNSLGDATLTPLVPKPGTDGPGISDEELHKVMDINLTSALLCARAFGPQMLERRAGKVINISSYVAARGGGSTLVYTTAKTALLGFTRALALEWAPYNIQVNAIAPGVFPDSADFPQDKRERYEAQVPLGRLGKPIEAGYLALYLASDASNFMTGQTLYLDGGMSL